MNLNPKARKKEYLLHIPVLKHRIFTWFPNAGFVSANSAGAKNIASSSGCAMSRHIRLLYSRGKELPKGEPEVDDNVQKIRTRGNVRASVYSVEVDIAGEAKCRVRLDTEVRVVVASSIEDHMRLDRVVIYLIIGIVKRQHPIARRVASQEENSKERVSPLSKR